MEKSLASSVRYLKGIGPLRARKLSRQGINCIEDLLYYFPRRYEDRTNFISISELKEDSVYTIKAKVISQSKRSSFRRRPFSIINILVGDGTGNILCVWFNQPYLGDYFKVGSTVILYGKVNRYAGRLQMSSPEFEVISEDNSEDARVDSLKNQPKDNAASEESLNIGRIVPVYSLPGGITQRHFRRIIKQALDEYSPVIADFLPYDIRSRVHLDNLVKALINIHFPESTQAHASAYERLSFDEFFLFQVLLALRKAHKQQKNGIAHCVQTGLAEAFIACLPFKLTAAQQAVISEIRKDMSAPMVMQRLLQGDVGSGKTVVATIAALFAIEAGYQAALMAPTEVLAKQHYQKITAQLSALKSKRKEIKIALLTGSLGIGGREEHYADIRQGRADFIIGTHALLQEKVGFNRLGLVIIDEQHKFGVGQRALLPEKGANPDVLIMTATPIPRTLAITLYGDLDISVIGELPAGRVPVKTHHFSESERLSAYQITKEELKKRRQAYIIYPVIEESFALDIAGAKRMHAELKSGEFRDFKLGLIHGKMKQQEQDEIMSQFGAGRIDLLVSTTVLEVGIDIPNATCMVVEKAERFGLAQLHQLRGRVGRSQWQSYCLLISDAQTPQAQSRLSAMVKFNDGFRIAEEDLKIRGPGEFFGSRQHGLSELKIANPLTQMQLLKKAREEAVALIKSDHGLANKQNSCLKEMLLGRFPEYEDLMLVG